ncbi:MAG: alpha/beta hydrolase [Gammaproteobacteria bacterium]|nr:alpha/beta hydrolase [Gammaproteobacteria bacterium]
MELTINSQAAYLGTQGRDIDPARPSIVFVHGAAMDHSVWTMFCRYFARHGFNTIAVDLPGHGRSDGEPLRTIEAIADWLAAMLKQLKISQAIMVGHSMGSLAVLDFAARYPDATERLAMVGTSVPMLVSDVLLDAAKRDDHAAFDMVTIWGHGPGAHIGGISAPGMWLTGSGLRLMEQSRPGTLFADLSACNDYKTGLEQAAKVACPTLLILGEKDMMTPPRAARKLQGALNQHETIVLRGVGHSLMSEDPNGLLDALATLTTSMEVA